METISLNKYIYNIYCSIFMSKNYVVFAGNVAQLTFYEALGYLHHITDKRILGMVKTGEIWKPEDADLLFHKDAKIKEVLLAMNLPQIYTVFRAEVLDEETLVEEEIPLFLERYDDISYEIYSD
ncbi:MAG: hypothetical protein U9P44_02420 [archaeon]|nr:hypothetical protein [archaeon]